MAIGRTNAGGSGAGGTLSVTGVAGSTVTVSNSDKSYTRTLGSDGKATFKGLASGTWTVTMTDGTQTAVARTVKITSDYTTITAYFAATINVTYPVGSTCTMTNGTTTLTAPDATGTWACIVPNAGTWTVTITDGTDTASDTVSVTTDGQTVSITVGYSLVLYSFGTKKVTFTDGHNDGVGSGSISWRTSDVYFVGEGGSATSIYSAYTFTPLVDLTNYKTLKCRIASMSTNNTSQSSFVLGIANSADTKLNRDGSISNGISKTSITATPSSNILTLDISTYDSMAAIIMGIQANNNAYQGCIRMSAVVTELWLEP